MTNNQTYILVVEDQAIIQRNLVESLSSEGYQVDYASSGEVAISKALSTHFDVIILDLMLPKLDGLSVLQSLRIKKDTPVLILTAKDSTADKVKGLDLGANDYLTKPFELEELKARVRALSRLNKAPEAKIISVSDIEIDLQNHLVRQQGNMVSLTEMEYILLEYLCLRRGQYLDKETLLRELFSKEESGDSKLLEVYVSNLRKKLGKTIIRNLRGKGYCIP